MAGLSKTQQQVVDRMRDGWKLMRSHVGSRYWLIRGTVVESVNAATVDALMERGHILQSAGRDGCWGVYKLVPGAPP